MVENRKKKISGIFMILLVLMMLISGSLAWQDVSQHKTNTFKTTSVKHNVVLVEEFKPVTDWKVNENKTNKISVRNGQETDDMTKVYDDAFVRVQLKEFMSIQKEEYKYQDVRLMVDKDGNFITGETESELDTRMIANGLTPADHTKAQYTDAVSGKELWYVETKAGDINGQYGKFLVDSINPDGDAESLVDGIVDASADADGKHQDLTHGEDLYTTHLWSEGQHPNKGESTSPFGEYVEWTFGADVVTLDEWDGKPGPKWVLDTSANGDGWAYWVEALVHSNTLVPKSVTSDILASATLIKQPDGVANYYIHTNLDAVSEVDLDKWTEADSKITDGIASAKDIAAAKAALLQSIQKAEAYNPTGSRPAAAALNAGIAPAKVVYNDTNVSQADVDSAKADLDTLIEAYEVDLVRIELEELLVVAKAKPESKYTAESYAPLKSAITNGDTVVASSTSTKNDLQSAINALNAGINGLVNAPLPPASVGDKVTFGGYNWTVLANKDGKSLVMVDQLSKADLEGVPTVTPEGYIKFHLNSNQYVSYNASAVKKVDDAFYEKLIQNDSSIENAVQAIKIEQEPFNGSGWTTRKDKPTLMDPSGEKTAFSLSVSDLNVYRPTQESLKNSAGSAYWLRSPAGSQASAARVHQNGGLHSDSVGYSTLTTAVRPALWIDLSQVTP